MAVTKAVEIREGVWSLDGEDLRYRLERRRGRRQVTLQFDPEIGLRVQTPRRLPLREVDRVLRQETDWLRLQVSAHRYWRESHPRRCFREGDLLPLLGEQWPLVLHRELGRRRFGIRREHYRQGPGRIHLFLPGNLGEVAEIGLIRRGLEAWYRRLARRLILARIAYWRRHLKVNPMGIGIRDTRTRWGSSSSTGNLSFNWKIVMAPPGVLDYLVVHELCHLVHHDHSQQFWRLVEKQLPDYRRRRAWLSRRGQDLYL